MNEIAYMCRYWIFNIHTNPHACSTIISPTVWYDDPYLDWLIIIMRPHAN